MLRRGHTGPNAVALGRQSLLPSWPAVLGARATSTPPCAPGVPGSSPVLETVAASPACDGHLLPTPACLFLPGTGTSQGPCCQAAASDGPPQTPLPGSVIRRPTWPPATLASSLPRRCREGTSEAGHKATQCWPWSLEQPPHGEEPMSCHVRGTLRPSQPAGTLSQAASSRQMPDHESHTQRKWPSSFAAAKFGAMVTGKQG